MDALSEEDCKQMELFHKLRRDKSLGRGELKLRDASDMSTQWVSCHGNYIDGEVTLEVRGQP